MMKSFSVIILCFLFINLNAQTEADDTTAVQSESVKPSLQSYSKFDFIPGAQVIF